MSVVTEVSDAVEIEMEHLFTGVINQLCYFRENKKEY